MEEGTDFLVPFFVEVSAEMERSMLIKMVFICAVSWLGLHGTDVSANELTLAKESERLDAVRDLILDGEKSGRAWVLHDYDKGQSPTCKVLLNDLLNTKKFESIEPTIIFEDEFPLKAKHGSDAQDKQREKSTVALGGNLTSELEECRAADAQGDEVRATKMFLGASLESGKPPYRIYLVPNELNPITSTNFVFWSEFDGGVAVGRKGYLWVDLQQCEYVKGVGVMTFSDRLERDPLGQMTALTKYNETSKSSLVVWEAVRDFRFEVTKFLIDKRLKETRGEEVVKCAWDSVEKFGG